MHARSECMQDELRASVCDVRSPWLVLALLAAIATLVVCSTDGVWSEDSEHLQRRLLADVSHVTEQHADDDLATSEGQTQRGPLSVPTCPKCIGRVRKESRRNRTVVGPLAPRLLKHSELLCEPPTWLHKPWIRTVVEQGQFASSVVRGINPPRGGVTISIRENRVHNVTLSRGRNSWVHPVRLKQYRRLFENACLHRVLPNCDLNINLMDEPKEGFFGFCRRTKHYAQFLLPNHRFTIDDILPGFNTYNEQLDFLLKDIPFAQKQPRAFVTMRPHRDKVPLLKEALRAPDEIMAYAHIGPPHYALGLSNITLQALLQRQMAGVQPLPWKEHRKYAFLIHPAANSYSDRMRLLLPLNSVVLKDVKSEKYEELYTSLMRPWRHYVPVVSTNLTSTVRMLRNDVNLSLWLIDQQHLFVQQVLRYDRLLDYVEDLLWILFGDNNQSIAFRKCAGSALASPRRMHSHRTVHDKKEKRKGSGWRLRHRIGEQDLLRWRVRQGLSKDAPSNTESKQLPVQIP